MSEFDLYFLFLNYMLRVFKAKTREYIKEAIELNNL